MFRKNILLKLDLISCHGWIREGYGKAPPERGTFFRLQVYKRVGISQVEVYKRVRKTVI